MPSSRLIKPGLLFLPRLPWRRKRIACDPLFEMTILFRTTILPTIHLSMKPSILHFSWSHLYSSLPPKSKCFLLRFFISSSFPSNTKCFPKPHSYVFYWGFSSPRPYLPIQMFFTEVCHLLFLPIQHQMFFIEVFSSPLSPTPKICSRGSLLYLSVQDPKSPPFCDPTKTPHESHSATRVLRRRHVVAKSLLRVKKER